MHPQSPTKPYAGPLALLVGTLLGQTISLPNWGPLKKVGKPILQFSIILLGLTLNFRQIVHQGLGGLGIAVLTLAFIALLAAILRPRFALSGHQSILISAGTAICGASAIAAFSSILESSEEDIAVSLGVIFAFNALAVFLFPFLAPVIHLTTTTAGAWAGAAIHDVASVAGASGSLGAEGVQIALAVKLSRVLFLVPALGLLSVWRSRRLVSSNPNPYEHKKLLLKSIPWFAIAFVLASGIGTALTISDPIKEAIRTIAQVGLITSLYLLGLLLPKGAISRLSWRPLAFGFILWLSLSILTLVYLKIFQP